MAHIEKVEVQTTDGECFYFDTKKEATGFARNHLLEIGRKEIPQTRTSIFWDDDGETAVLMNASSMETTGYEVAITPMLISEETWKKIKK